MNLYRYNSINLDLEHERFDLPDPKNFYLHTHAYYEICWFLSGNAVYHIEGNVYALQQGDIVLIRPNEAHYVEVMPGTAFERVLLSFGQTFTRVIDPDHTLSLPFWDREPGCRNLYRPSDLPSFPLEQHFENMLSDNDRVHILTHMLALLKDLSLAFERMTSYEKQTESLETKVIRLINDNYHLDLSLQEISDRFFISRAQLCRRFKKATGTSIGKYIALKRLTAARELILQGRKAADVCFICGFRDYSTFYRAYTRHFGNSPTGERR